MSEETKFDKRYGTLSILYSSMAVFLDHFISEDYWFNIVDFKKTELLELTRNSYEVITKMAVPDVNLAPSSRIERDYNDFTGYVRDIGDLPDNEIVKDSKLCGRIRQFYSYLSTQGQRYLEFASLPDSSSKT